MRLWKTRVNKKEDKCKYKDRKVFNRFVWCRCLKNIVPADIRTQLPEHYLVNEIK